MKTNLPYQEETRRPNRPGQRSNRGIALVITLLMLSVITFLAIAFLALTQRNRSATTTTVDNNMAQMMSDAALARAQAEIVARMMAQSNLLSYDYMASHSYVSPYFTNTGIFDPNDVNYDQLPSGAPLSSAPASSGVWEKNIANLLYDPRVPVFVPTNPVQYPSSNDFRFWVDVNQNGHFETNGYLPVLDNSGNRIVDANGNVVTNYYNGEPEWIGVLRDPLYPHSATNPFLGRYAYMVLPLGKTLDLNYIHNDSKSLIYDSVKQISRNSTLPYDGSQGVDGYIRNQGVGSWELNLAAFLLTLNTNIYQFNLPLPAEQYEYDVPQRPQYDSGITGANQGLAFNDAWSMLYYRCNPLQNWAPSDLASGLHYGLTLAPQVLSEYFNTNGIDEYGFYAGLSPNLPNFILPTAYSGMLKNPSLPWPGSYNTNMYYDMEDLFDTNKTSVQFVSRLTQYMTTNTDAYGTTRYDGQIQYDRDTFQRLLAGIGTGSGQGAGAGYSPEYGVFVYSNGFTFLGNNNVISYVTNANGPLVSTANGTYLNVNGRLTLLGTPVGGTYPTWLRTKVNLNYDNTSQIANGPFALASTNLTNWGPLTFFTNAADLLLRSQEFPITNINGAPIAFNHFGITNIPVYNSGNPQICYTAQIHRMLQLAANIYQDANATNWLINESIQRPHVFRPICSAGYDPYTKAWTVYITGYEEMTAARFENWLTTSQPFLTLDDSNNIPAAIRRVGVTNVNYWGIPWVVAAVNGLPSFNRLGYTENIGMSRDILCVKTTKNLSSQWADYTNEFYVMQVTNASGMDVWNSSQNTFIPKVTIFASNLLSITFTNNSTVPGTSYAYTTNFTSEILMPTNNWRGRTYLTLFPTNVAPIPLGYYSTASNGYLSMAVLTSEQNLVNGENLVSFGTVPGDLEQAPSRHPQYDWSMIVSNRVLYYMYDQDGYLLDFVNLGPYVSSNNITSNIIANANLTAPAVYWELGPLGPHGAGPMLLSGQSQVLDYGAYREIQDDKANFTQLTGTATTNCFGPPDYFPLAALQYRYEWVANDPLVHYTFDDLTWPGAGITAPPAQYAQNAGITGQLPITNDLGSQSTRYQPWLQTSQNNNISLQDALVNNSDAWEFPTNKFPSIGWLGRVHRGTPWQTVFLKAATPSLFQWTNQWVSCPYTMPSNDWSLLDLFTAAPNDNAARGLLSVNQTGDAAWAAVLSGVIVGNGNNPGIVIDPTNIFSMVDSNGGINSIRSNYTTTLGTLVPIPFRHIGDILAAPALTTSNSVETSKTAVPDYVTEAIPQQTLGLLKVGLPQFVIYSWGQALRPKNIDLGGGSINSSFQNLCTNYEITGEYETRTVCHIVGDPYAQHPKIVIDSFNLEPGY